MLNQLLETKQVTQRKTGGTLLSVVMHVVVIGTVINLTQRTVGALPAPVEVAVRRIPLEPKPIAPVERRPDQAATTQRTRLGFTVLIAPVDVPLNIPPIDLTTAPTDPNAFRAIGVPGGQPDGDSTLTAPIVGDQPMSSFEVDKAAAALPGSPSPAYPDMLKASGVEGSTLVQFVVDTLGRAEAGSFKVLESSHDAFGTAVRVTLPRMRFLPAEAGGRKVRMLVRQQFAFALDR